MADAQQRKARPNRPGGPGGPPAMGQVLPGYFQEVWRGGERPGFSVSHVKVDLGAGTGTRTDRTWETSRTYTSMKPLGRVSEIADPRYHDRFRFEDSVEIS